jgi:tetratricopeptide (TPR) repeat protein
MLNMAESPARATVNQGGLRLARGDLDGAEELYREAILIDPDNSTAHANLGYLLALRGRHEEAIGEAERAIALDPARSAPWAHMGMSQVALGSIGDGLSSLSRAVRLDPENHFAWDAMGRTLLALGRPDEAEIAWASAVAARPGDVDLLISLATALAAQDKTMEAIRVLIRATSIAPDSARAWTQLGVVALVRQDYGTAGEALLEALDLDPAYDEARFHLAVLHVLVGAADEARAALRALILERSEFEDEARALLARLPRQDQDEPARQPDQPDPSSGNRDLAEEVTASSGATPALGHRCCWTAR